eukprot:GHRQ01029788.1.p1 GENE.GHRQ01029788.1~~GHRQ01029788.1.p1  ORF type:complete len:119 (+),score=1.86 GHRQ01029788.1:76-432(+)
MQSCSCTADTLLRRTSLTAVRVGRQRASCLLKAMNNADARLQRQIMAATANTLNKTLEGRVSLTSIDDYRIVNNIDASAVPEDLKKDCILFYTPDTEPLARKIAAEGSHVQLGNIRWK